MCTKIAWAIHTSNLSFGPHSFISCISPIFLENLQFFYIGKLVSLVIVIMLAYLYCATYTRMTMNASSPPCEQRRITFNDDGQKVQLARPELPAPHYICMYRLLPTTPPSPSRHYYPRFIAGTNYRP